MCKKKQLLKCLALTENKSRLWSKKVGDVKDEGKVVGGFESDALLF